MEVSGFGAALGVMKLDNGHVYGLAGLAAPFEPTASFGRGKIYPNKGRTADDVAKGLTGSAGGGFIFGTQVWTAIRAARPRS